MVMPALAVAVPVAAQSGDAGVGVLVRGGQSVAGGAGENGAGQIAGTADEAVHGAIPCRDGEGLAGEDFRLGVDVAD